MATFRSKGPSDNWSNSGDWQNGKVPVNGQGQSINLWSNSTADLGTAAHPFVTPDIIGALPYGVPVHPLNMTVTGFIKAGEEHGLAGITIAQGASLELTQKGGLDPAASVSLAHGSKLILDNPGTTLSTALSGAGEMELGNLQFDAVSFIPAPGNPGTTRGGQAAFGGKMLLTEHGRTVFTISSVKQFDGTAIGHDMAGHEFLKLGS